MHFLLSLASPKPQQPTVWEDFWNLCDPLSFHIFPSHAKPEWHGSPHPVNFVWEDVLGESRGQKRRNNEIVDIHWVPALSCQKFPKNSTYTIKCKPHDDCSRSMGKETEPHWGEVTFLELHNRWRAETELELRPIRPHNSCVIPVLHGPQSHLRTGSGRVRSSTKGWHRDPLLLRWHTPEIFSYTHKRSCMAEWTCSPIWGNKSRK